MKLPHKHYKDDDKIDFLIEEEKVEEISKAFNKYPILKDFKYFGYCAIEKNVY